MNTKGNYLVICDEINLVLQVKILDNNEESALFTQIRQKISGVEKYFSYIEYKEFICKKIIIDYEEIVSGAIQHEIDSDAYRKLLDNLYSAVCIIYPPLSLEFVAIDLNSEKHSKLDKMKNSSDFLKNLTETLRSQIGKDTVKKKVSKVKVPPTIKTKTGFEKLESEMKKSIIGQDHAIDSVIKHMKLISAGLSHSSSFFFVGPTGVGKTELSKLIGSSYSGHFFKINCAEYAGAHEYAKLIGSPPGYVGHSDKSILKEKSDISNKWVFLFDEIEKADAKLADFLLSLLDDGTCTDNMGNVLDFSESIFIFTSNQGVSDVKYSSLGFVKNKPSKESINSTIFDSVKKKFSPEFMNRIDEVIFFNSLSKEDVRKIVINKLSEYPINLTEDLIDYVIEKSYSFEYGARNVARYIKNNIATVIAEAILEKQVKMPAKFILNIKDGLPQVCEVINEKPAKEQKTKKSNQEVLEVRVGGENPAAQKNE